MGADVSKELPPAPPPPPPPPPAAPSAAAAAAPPPPPSPAPSAAAAGEASGAGSAEAQEEVVQFGEVSVSPFDPTAAWEQLEASCRHERVHTNDTPLQPRSSHLRVVCISDTHGKHAGVPHVPPGDILIHAGDFTNTGSASDVESFANWFGSLPHKHKIVIAGNHDTTLHPSYYDTAWKRFHRVKQDATACLELVNSSTSFTYLEDAAVEIQGYRIYGSPWQPEFCDWAFNLERGEECDALWREIPADTDILITHGPPVGHGDKCQGAFGRAPQRAGCVNLLWQVQHRIRPLYHIFGHIHEGYGMTTDGTTTFINASTCTFNYRPTNPPVVFDIPRSKSPGSAAQHVQVLNPTKAAAPQPGGAPGDQVSGKGGRGAGGEVGRDAGFAVGQRVRVKTSAHECRAGLILCLDEEDGDDGTPHYEVLLDSDGSDDVEVRVQQTALLSLLPFELGADSGGRDATASAEVLMDRGRQLHRLGDARAARDIFVQALRQLESGRVLVGDHVLVKRTKAGLGPPMRAGMCSDVDAETGDCDVMFWDGTSGGREEDREEEEEGVSSSRVVRVSSSHPCLQVKACLNLARCELRLSQPGRALAYCWRAVCMARGEISRQQEAGGNGRLDTVEGPAAAADLPSMVGTALYLRARAHLELGSFGRAQQDAAEGLLAKPDNTELRRLMQTIARREKDNHTSNRKLARDMSAWIESVSSAQQQQQ